MNGSHLDRWLLVNYSGYPFALNSLILDNGLANLAGSLLRDGKSVHILDYATVSVLKRFASPDLTRALTRAWDRVFPADGSTPTAANKLRALLSLSYGEGYRGRQQRRVLHEITEEIIEHVEREKIDAVGFKLWNGDGIMGSAAIARELRRRCPNVRIFGGGPQVDMFMEHLLEPCAAFDALVHGEGEETIRRLAESGGDGAAFDGISNLLFRRNGKMHTTESRAIEDLESLAPPVYDPEIYPAAAGNEKIRIIVIDESRGCGNNCAFCIHPIKSASTRRMRVKDAGALLNDVQALQQKYGISTFRFAGSCTPYKLLNDFADEVLQRGTKLMYGSFGHVRNHETADFGKIRESGCVTLFFGVESGSQRVLDAMNKQVNVADIEPALRSAMAADIYTVASLIYPAPFDDDESGEETLQRIKSVRPSALAVQPPLVIPRTDWFLHPDRYGIEIKSRAAYIRTGMRWKAKNLLPPAFWSPLPVRINGLTFKQVLKKTSAFCKRLEKETEVPVGLSDDIYLMVRRTGMDPVEFRNVTRKAFFSGDVGAIRELAERINPNC